MSCTQRTAIKCGRVISNTPTNRDLNTTMTWLCRASKRHTGSRSIELSRFCQTTQYACRSLWYQPASQPHRRLLILLLEGLEDKGLHTRTRIYRSLKLELNVIDDRGFSKYFLTMKSIVDVATDMMLTGPGRGSAAGSLVAYALNITQVDPIKHGLCCSLASCARMRLTILILIMMYQTVWL